MHKNVHIPYLHSKRISFYLTIVRPFFFSSHFLIQVAYLNFYNGEYSIEKLSQHDSLCSFQMCKCIWVSQKKISVVTFKCVNIVVDIPMHDISNRIGCLLLILVPFRVKKYAFYPFTYNIKFYFKICNVLPHKCIKNRCSFLTYSCRVNSHTYIQWLLCLCSNISH